jgi:release factor glutamine methyltransferase
MNINQYFQRLKSRFSRETIPNSSLDARLIIQEGACLTAEDFITRGETPLTDQQIETIEQFAERRLAGEPISRIFSRREFWGLEFEVTKDTLDPRADTEILVEKALERARKIVGKTEDESGGKKAPLVIADIGTGTGCILISMLTELPEAEGVAVDLSPEALAVAQRNARTHGVDGRIRFIQGSYLEPLKGLKIGLIVSNPPYIPESDIANLAVEVRNHDPMMALSGGKDGLEAYKILCREAKKVLPCGGFALYEIGQGQAPDLIRLVDESNANLEGVYPDMAGIPRVVEISYGDNEEKACSPH